MRIKKWFVIIVTLLSAILSIYAAVNLPENFEYRLNLGSGFHIATWIELFIIPVSICVISGVLYFIGRYYNNINDFNKKLFVDIASFLVPLAGAYFHILFISESFERAGVSNILSIFS